MSQDREKHLAEKLREVCTPYGDERGSKLRESADILFEMGELYLEKVEVSKEMEQKFNFIKCAALLHGARVRYDKFLHDKSGVKKVEHVIKSLDRLFIRTAASCVKEIPTKVTFTSLYDISSDLLAGLQNLRMAEKRELGKLEEINGNLDGAKIKQKKLEKIKAIKTIMEKNTKDYKLLMQKITNHCISILEEPPCPFAIVGLGSLARSEITLYSDFEHVIVLKEGIQNCADYSNTQEYFRWFTVLFQIIMIGLGETVIRSVGVESINDLYSEDKSKNWFYDMFTPSGIAFDGMVPHSCNTPLGRQEFTENKSHKVELIQPASIMASYLTKDEHLKNGYYLKDMLVRTCLVFGDKNVYNVFRHYANDHIPVQSTKKIRSEVLRRVYENVNMNVAHGHMVAMNVLQKIFDVKKVLYRPISVLTSYIGKICNIESENTFNILSRLQEGNILQKHGIDSQIFTYGFAIACELRLKLYSSSGTNRCRATEGDIYSLITKETFGKCSLCIEILSATLGLFLNFEAHDVDMSLLDNIDREFIFQLSGNLNADFPDNSNQSENTAEIALLFKKTIDTYLRTRDTTIIPDDSPIPHDYKSPYKYHSVKYSEEWLKNKEQLTKVYIARERDPKNPSEMLDFLMANGFLAGLYKMQDRKQEEFEALEVLIDARANMIYKSLGTYAYTWDFMLQRAGIYMIMSMQHIMTPQNVQEYCEEKLAEQSDRYSHFLYRYGMAVAQLRSGYMKGREKLKEVQEELTRPDESIPQIIVLSFFQAFFLFQLINNLSEDAYQTMEAANIILESQLGGYEIDSNILELFGHRRAVECFKREEKQDSTKKKTVEMYLQAINFFRLPQNQGSPNQYLALLRNIFVPLDLYDPKDVSLIHRLYHEAPMMVKKLARGYLTSWILSVLVKSLHDTIHVKKYSPKYVATVSKLVEMFPYICCHPYLISQLRMVEIFFKKKLADAVVERNRENFEILASPKTLAAAETKFTSIMLGYMHECLKSDTSIYWQNLFKVNTKCRRDEINELITYVSFSIQFSFWQRINDFISSYCDKMVYNECAKLQQIYRDGIEEFLDWEYVTAAKAFWKIMNNSALGCRIHKDSVVMLSHCIIKVMKDSGFSVTLDFQNPIMYMLKKGDAKPE